MKQGTCVTIRAGKGAEAVIKQIATQEIQAEKEKMQRWKQIVIQEVSHQLQIIRQIQEGAIQSPRQSLNVELEKMRKKLPQVESRLVTLKKEIIWLKTQKKVLNRHPIKDILAEKKNPTSTKLNESETQNDKKSYVELLTAPSAMARLEKIWIEVLIKSKKNASAHIAS